MRDDERMALEKGINLFNEGRYFEAHEEWEDEWRLMREGEERTFFSGLILAAGSFVHYVRHECAGAKELLERSITALRTGIEDHPGISVADFIGRLERLRSAFGACSFSVAPGDLPRILRRSAAW